MSRYTTIFLFASLLLVVGCLGDDAPNVEKEDDSKATESQQVKVKTEPEKRAPTSALGQLGQQHASATQTKVMIMPPVSLMIAMPHPSGRFLMLFPATHLVPVLPMPYAQQAGSQQHQLAHQPTGHHMDHPALFAARHQMLYGSYQQQPSARESSHFFGQSPSSSYHPQPSYSTPGGYGSKRMSSDIN